MGRVCNGVKLMFFKHRSQLNISENSFLQKTFKMSFILMLLKNSAPNIA